MKVVNDDYAEYIDCDAHRQHQSSQETNYFKLLSDEVNECDRVSGNCIVTAHYWPCGGILYTGGVFHGSAFYAI